MTRFVRAALFAAALAIVPTAASADTLITPYVGWNWGGSSGAESTRVSFDTRTYRRLGDVAGLDARLRGRLLNHSPISSNPRRWREPTSSD